MTLSLPTKVGDARTQQCLDRIAMEFPVGLTKAQKELFPQLPAAGNIRQIRGRVETTATEAKILGGVGFTVERLGAGILKITLATELSEVPTVLATGESATEINIVSCTANGKKNIELQRIKNGTAEGKDGIWNFQISGTI